MKPLYSHQDSMAKFGLDNNIVFNTSDPGTGKTRGTLEAYKRRHEQLSGVGRLLVVAPLSILKSSWGDDINEFTDFSYAVAHGSAIAREEAFRAKKDITLLNHDGAVWLARNRELLDGFTDLVIDESTAFKNRTAQRSKAMCKLAEGFDHITSLTGTPNSNTVTDIWHQVYIMDRGRRLGNRFFQFRGQVCIPVQVGPQPQHVKWQDKPGATDIVADLLSDITIRFRFEDCLDIPPNSLHYMYVDMPPKIMRAYRDMEENSILETKQGLVSAIHAGSRVQKLLQILSGAVYDATGTPHFVHSDRYALVMQLVAERDHSVVAFNWHHQKNALCALADSMGITYGVIDGETPAKQRANVVEQFQAGLLQTVFCHPQSAGHGLTLTRGRTTIWCSPTYNAEHFQQFNRRIYRAGQDKATETICIAARGTKEVEVYERLNDKLSRMSDLLDVLTDAA